MRLNSLLLLTGAVCLASISPGLGQTFQPKHIHFAGPSGYSDEELMAITGLRPGLTVSTADVNSRVQKLMEAGVFEGITYRFDGIDLVFTIKPAAQLFPIRLENIPLAQTPELDGQIRQRVPLYRGKVPSEGQVLSDVRGALEDLLKAHGIPANIQSSPYGQAGQTTASAISFRIETPEVLVGEVQWQGAAKIPDVPKTLASIVGSVYDCQNSAISIAHAIEEAYRATGYLEPKVDVAQLPTVSVTPQALRVPFRISAEAGPLYRVAKIQLAPDLLVSQADFDKQAQTHPGDVASAEHVAQNWHFIERQYHNRGYIKVQVKPSATLDHGHSTVSYMVTAAPGPVYSMGRLTVENVSEDLRAAILKAWKMPEGSTFNEGAILGFFATHGVNPQLERVFANVQVNYVLHLNDDARTVDTVLRLERRS